VSGYGTSVPLTTNPLRLRLEEFDRLTSLRGWNTDAERARQLGVSGATMTNLRKGKVNPGPKFIDQCLKAFGTPMYDVLFDRQTAA
jgi:transcriptional regulator with XRE-family HTH domain